MLEYFAHIFQDFLARGLFLAVNTKIFMHIFLYGVFSVLTTILNIFIYWLCTRIFGLQVVLSTVIAWVLTVIAWVLAVLFAYMTNRKYVFHSTENSSAGIIREIAEFFFCRLATGIIDVAIMYLFVDVLGFNDVIIKTASNIIVIILNYIASRLFIFKGENFS